MESRDKEAPRTFAFPKLYKEFGENTTMHGLRRALANRNSYRGFVWTILFMSVFGFATFQFIATMRDFYSYPVTTVVTVHQDSKPQFPDITICNMNRKKKSLASSWLEELSDENDTETSPSDAFINANLRIAATEEKSVSGHSISDMLVRCIFNRRICTIDQFIPLITATHGTCNTFRASDPDSKFKTRPGPQNGLILELYIEQREYLSITSKAGIKVMVHEPYAWPFAEDGGILAKPGAATNIAVKKTVTHRLPSPYSTCLSAHESPSSYLNLFKEDKYTQETCEKMCYQRFLYETCQCCDADLPCKYQKPINKNITQPEDNGYIQWCDSDTELSCEFDVEDQFLSGVLGCDNVCPPACDQTTYQTVVSESLWPSDAYFDVFLRKINHTVLQNMTFNTNASIHEFVNKNFLRLDIYLESLECLGFAMQPKYDWNNLLGNVGGQLGLWMGFSLLTGIELIELFIDTVVFCLRRLYRRKIAATDMK